MTAPTPRETADHAERSPSIAEVVESEVRSGVSFDHAELAAELRAFEGSDDLGNGDFTVCEFAADTIGALLSEIAALRGERDEAVELLRVVDLAARTAASMAAANYTISAEALGEKIYNLTTPFIANQGADQ